MKRISITVAILVSVAIRFPILVGLSIIPASALADSRPKVLLIPREGYSADIELMLNEEVLVMSRMLRFAGYKVEVATSSGMPIVSPGRDLKPDMVLAKVKKEEYAGFMMPCMAVGGIPGPPVAPEAVAIAKYAALRENR